jgi:hypothetical protein
VSFTMSNRHHSRPRFFRTSLSGSASSPASLAALRKPRRRLAIHDDTMPPKLDPETETKRLNLVVPTWLRKINDWRYDWRRSSQTYRAFPQQSGALSTRALRRRQRRAGRDRAEGEEEPIILVCCSLIRDTLA